MAGASLCHPLHPASHIGWRAFFWLLLVIAVASIIGSYQTTTLHIQNPPIEPLLFVAAGLDPLWPGSFLPQAMARGGSSPFWLILVFPIGTIVPDGQYESVVRIYDPDGDVVLEHYKFGGAQFEGSLPGSGVLRFVDTPYGRLGAAICWDADFPDVIRQAGIAEIDLLLLPSNDWYAIRDIHPGMAAFCAVGKARHSTSL